MSDPGRPMLQPEMTCDEVAELAGLFVLGALEPAEHHATAAHLASCAKPHAEIDEVGSVVPALAALVDPIDAPPALKARVMTAVADAAREGIVAAQSQREKQPGRYSTGGRVLPPRLAAPSGVTRRDEPARPWQPPAWVSWGSALAAVLIIAVIGVWGFGAQSRASNAEERAAILTEAIRSFGAPDSSIAILRESAAGGSSGFAALAADGTAYLVMVNLAPVAADQAYQAWYIVGEQAISAGLLTVDENGLAVFVDSRAVPGTQVVALTREPKGGSDQPTTAPFVTGELRRQA